MRVMHSRRRVLAGLSLTGAAAFVGAPKSLHAEPPPETTTVRIGFDSSPCNAPGKIADDLLRAEGFTDIRYMPHSLGAVVRSDADFDFDSVTGLLPYLDAGEPVVVLTGMHPGCCELFAQDSIQTISDLKGKRVGISQLGTGRHLFLEVVAAYVGLDPHTDINWVTSPKVSPAKLFEDGKIDAFLGFPPEPQELRSRKIGRVISSTTTDRPWSQYFCCMCVGNADYVRDHPVATKRYLRATFKAAEICATEKAKAAQRLVEGGFTPRYDYALQTLTELPYDTWRKFDPEDTIRFYALRLHELGMIKSSPRKIIANGTNFHFLDELKRELKT